MLVLHLEHPQVIIKLNKCISWRPSSNPNTVCFIKKTNASVCTLIQRNKETEMLFEIIANGGYTLETISS